MTQRHAYLDWVRGLAVLIMIEAHVLDAWTLEADRSRTLFGYAMVLGGFGAPLFLFLAGVALVLSAESKFRRSGALRSAWLAVHRRGWQIFGLAFLFRLQAYLLGGGYDAAGLLKVDILNIMGPAIAAAALLGMATRRRTLRGVMFAAAAVGIALVTPPVRGTPLLDWLPDPVEWYFRPTPGRTNFTFFPWAGFLFAGAAVGQCVHGVRQAARVPHLQAGLALTGLLVVLLSHYLSLQPSIYERSEYWTSSPTYFLLRVGVLTVLLPAAYLWEHAPLRHKLSSWSPLEEFGRSSLFVYWIHVEMVYGFFSRPIRRALTLEQAVAAYAVFTVFLLGLVLLKDKVLERRAIYLTDSKSVI